MHILVISSERYMPKDNFLEGIFQQDQAHAIKRAGYKVGVISPTEFLPVKELKKRLLSSSVGIKVINDQGIPVFKHYGWRFIPGRFQEKIEMLFYAGKILFRKYISKYGMPDIIHAHNALYAGLLASKIKEQWGLPFVLTEHSSAYVRKRFGTSEIEYIKEAFKNADQRLVVSPALGQILERVIGDAVCPWKCIPNILSRIFEENDSFTKKHTDSDGKFRFVNVGSLRSIKGQADLIRAFANKFSSRNNVQLRIGGDGQLRKELEKLSKELKIDEQVIFLGQLSRSQVFRELQLCDVYVCSSHFETFGVTLLEAISCGKPVISTKCGGPECIVHKENGVLVPPGDILKLGETMKNVMQNIETYDPLWIRNDCIKRFGEQAIVDQLLTIYQNIL